MKEKLQKESAMYESKKKEWAKTHNHEFVLIHGDNVIGFYLDFNTAFKAAIDKFGPLEDFFIEEVLDHIPTNFAFLASDHANSIQ